MILEIYGNMNTDILLFTDQIWKIQLTERMVSCISPSLHGKRKIMRESKATRKYFSQTSFLSQKSGSNFSGAGHAKNWKIKPVDT